jgi:glc operon protein GlcG
VPELDLAAARNMTDAVFQYARQNGLQQAVAVVDEGGHTVLISRMDGCSFLAPDIAFGKAHASAAFKLSSADLAQRWRDNPGADVGIIGVAGHHIVPVQGALPICDGGRCVGAIGASGGLPRQDEEAVRAGLTAAGFSDRPT